MVGKNWWEKIGGKKLAGKWHIKVAGKNWREKNWWENAHKSGGKKLAGKKLGGKWHIK